MKVIIAGGREFNNYKLLCEVCDGMSYKDLEIVSGVARGADKLGVKYAEERGYKIKEFPANWNKYGRSAGPIRNNEMSLYADALIAFWDGKSKGTGNMIKLAKKRNLKLKVIYYS